MKMIDLDHRVVVVGGLILSCLFYQVPLYTICFVIGCGFLVYVRNKYNDGWRFTLFGGGGNNGFGFIRQMKHGRYRPANTLSPHNITSSSNTTPVTHRNDNSNSISPFANLSRRSSLNYSFISTPKLRLDPKNYDGSPRFHNQNHYFHSRILSPSFPSDIGRPRHRTSVYDVPNINNKGRMDSTFEGPVGTSKPKYSGVGVYPFVQLEPHRPTLLSHCNSTMVKNRVTVKVALPERQSSNLSANRSTPKVNFSSSSQECGTVVEALNTRKRPLKDDGSNNIEHSATKRRHHQSENDPNVPPHLPSEITQHFESQLSDESLAILSQPMETTTTTTIESFEEAIPSTVGQAKTNAIHSSYSSSVRFEKSVSGNRTKRKPESICGETPEVKFGRSDSPIRKDRSTEVDKEEEEVEVESSEDRISDESSKVEPPKSAETVTGYSFHSTMTGARNPMPVHVPTYIPSMEDYLEDKKAEEERLKKILGRFTVVNTNKNKEDSSSISIVPISTYADSNLQTSMTLSVTKESVTQSENLNVPSVVGTTSASSTLLPTSNQFVTSTTELESVSKTVSDPPPYPSINLPFTPTTVVDKPNSDSPFNNSITPSFTVAQTVSSANNTTDPITTTITSPNSLTLSTQAHTTVTNTLTTSSFVTTSTAPFSFGTMSQNTSSTVPSLQFKASETTEQQKVLSSPFTFGSKPLEPNPVTIADATKPSSIGTGGFSFPIPNAVSTVVAASSSSGPSSLFSNVSSSFGSNQIANTVTTAVAATTESSNLNNISQFSSSSGSSKPVSTFGGGFSFGQNFNPPKTDSSAMSGQSNASAGFQFGGSALQNSNPFGNATTATSTAIPTFGLAPPTYGSAMNSAVPTFGSAKNSTIPTFSSAVPTFGSASNSAVPAFGTATNSAVPTFGTATNSAVPTFGSTTNSASSTFGAATSTAVPTFGTATSLTVSTFGTTTSAVPTFGSSIPTFGSATSTAVPTFGTPTSTFGSISTAIPSFGAAKPAFGSNVVNGTNVNGETTNGGQFGIGQPFSFGSSTQSNQTNHGVFTFGNATPSNNNSTSFVVPPTGSQSFDFSSSSKPSFNFGPSSTPISGTSTPTQNMNMFSVTPSNSTSTRRSKHPPQRHRFHR